MIVPRKVFPQESGNQPSKKNRSNSDEGDWYMRLVSVSELVYCNDFSYTVMHTLFIWFFTSQIIHRHKSTCKRCWDLQNSSISKAASEKKKGCRSSKTTAQCPFLCSLSQTSQVDQLLTWCSRIHLKGFMSSSSAILSHKCLLMSVIVSFSSTASHLNPVLNHQTKSEFTATNRSSPSQHCLPKPLLKA